MTIKKFWAKLAVAAFPMLFAASAFATPVIDQSAPPNFSSLGMIWNNYQGFTPTAGNIVGAGVRLDQVSGADTITYSIYKASDVSATTHLATGTALASGHASLAAGATGWLDIFWDSVALTPGSAYFLNLEHANPNSYQAFSGSWSHVGDPLYMYGANYTNYSTIAYRTYTETSVPEPGALALVALGLIVFGAMRRKG